MPGYATYLIQPSPYNAEKVTIYEPHDKKRAMTRRPFVYAHGANGDASTAVDTVNNLTGARICGALASLGYAGIAADFAGVTPFGNDAALASIEAAVAYINSTGWCLTDKIFGFGTSMGNMNMSRYAEAHGAAKVAGLIGMIPGIDIVDLCTRNVLGLHDAILTAWGLPTTNAPNTIPIRGVQLDPSNIAAMAGIQHDLYYSSADTVVLPSTVAAYVAARTAAGDGAIVHSHLTSSSANHSDAAVSSMLFADVLALVQASASR